MKKGQKRKRSKIELNRVYTLSDFIRRKDGTNEMLVKQEFADTSTVATKTLCMLTDDVDVVEDALKDWLDKQAESKGSTVIRNVQHHNTWDGDSVGIWINFTGNHSHDNFKAFYVEGMQGRQADADRLMVIIQKYSFQL